MKLVIFDMGGVVCENSDVVPAIVKHLGISEETFYTMAGERDLRLLFCGDISENEFWKRFAQGLGHSVPVDLWSRFYNPRLNQKIAGTVRELQKRARVVVGTNTLDSHYRVLKERGYFEGFDAVYASNKMGAAKPSPDFYWRILQEERCRPADSIFIDDTRENVVAADSIGILGIHFTTSQALQDQLRRLFLIA